MVTASRIVTSSVVGLGLGLGLGPGPGVCCLGSGFGIGLVWFGFGSVDEHKCCVSQARRGTDLLMAAAVAL